MRNRITLSLLVAVLLGSFVAMAPTPTLAWGSLGHKIVCELAFHELNPKAQTEVRRLIKLDPDFRFFSDSCTFPDQPPRKREPEHFVNIPRDFDRFTSGTQCPVAEKCLLTAIAADRRILESKAGDAKRLEALKFLGHWVGDLHQPLHVSYEDDKGGNKIRGSGGPCSNNLHSTWDTCIIQQRLGTDVRDVAFALTESITETERAEWKTAPIETWANESYAITRQPSVGYCIRVGPKCVYETTNESFDKGETEKTVTVDAAYLDTHGPVVAERLKRAGVRLGQMLNEALGK